MKNKIIKLTLAICILFIIPMSAMADSPALDVSKDGNNITVAPLNAPDDSIVFFTAYDKYGRLATLETWSPDAESHIFSAPSDYEYAKIFMADLKNMKPHCEPETVTSKPTITEDIYTLYPRSYRYSVDENDIPIPRSAYAWFDPSVAPGCLPNDFTFKYKLHDSNEYIEGEPYNAGVYDVLITRPADETYAEFKHLYENVITIQKDFHFNGTFAPVPVDKTFSSFEFKLSRTQKPYTEGAQIIYEVSPELITVYQGEPGSNRVYIPDPLPGCSYYYRVRIINDPNYDDYLSGWYGGSLSDILLPYPTTPWKDQRDADWMTNNKDTYIINTARDFASFMSYVNDERNTFEGKTVLLANNLDMREYIWEPIGNETTPFKGTFDGQGHTIRNLYINGYPKHAGLFGYVEEGAVIKNITVTDADFCYGHQGTYIGAIAGKTNGAQIINCTTHSIVAGNKSGGTVGGIVGIATDSIIENCVNYSTVECLNHGGGIAGKITGDTIVDSCINYGLITSAGYACGGIVGYATDDVHVVNCINSCEVSSPVKGTYGFGGIVGYVISGHVYNCLNKAYVSAYNCVGGIVGLNEADGRIYNCYSGIKDETLYVYGFSNDERYAGAIVGRNRKDQGLVNHCYYIPYTARNYLNFVLAAGTKTSSSDTVDNLSVGSFADMNSDIIGKWYNSDNGDPSGKLIDVLNRWQQDNLFSDYKLAKKWIVSEDGYPVPRP